MSNQDEAVLPGLPNEGGKDVSANSVAKSRTSVVLLGPAIDPEEKEYTVSMFGVPRGGTTMVAGIVRRLGIAIGENMDYNLEDPDFCRKPVPEIRQTLRARNKALPVWGWKFPAAARYLPKILPELRNPRFIVIWRDPLTAALRGVEKADRTSSSAEEMTVGSLAAIEKMIALQLLNVEVIRMAGCPTLMISYEKAMRRPHDTIAAIASFIGAPLPDNLDELLQFMQPESYK